MQRFRERIYSIVETADDDDMLSKLYDLIMLVAIVVSLLPLALKSTDGILAIADKTTVSLFIIDYIARLFTADLKLKRGNESFFVYPFTPMAIIDLLSILPSLIIVSGALKILRVLRLFRTLRVFRVFKIIRYSKSITIILNVIKKQRESLLVVCGLAAGYILVSALIIISIEPETFETFFDALYWATVSLTTVGYGDIYAVSTVGKVITMISSLFGIAIVALPAGIITAGYMDELNKTSDETK